MAIVRREKLDLGSGRHGQLLLLASRARRKLAIRQYYPRD